ncbi:MAG: PAS domain S-box protein [Spirochaetaceae bacterium]|nr:PAS domain S-box protein [Spirochaetaceae bacterium]
MAKIQISILLVESESKTAEDDSAELIAQGYNVLSAQSGEHALQAMEKNHDIDLILMELNGESIMTAPLLIQKKELPLLFRTDGTDRDLLEKTVSLLSFGYIARSGITPLVISTIESALRNFRITSEKIENLESDAELLKLFLEFNPSYVFFKDHEIKTLKLSHNYEKMLGMPIDHLLGKTMFELFPSDLAKSMDADDKGILERGIPFEKEEELNDHFYSTIKFPLKRRNGQSLLAGFSIDITRRVQAEKKLLQEIEEHKSVKEQLISLRQHLADIINSMPSMLIAVDMEGFVTDWNIQAAENTGISLESAMGQSLETLLPRFSREMKLVDRAIAINQEQAIHKKSYQKDSQVYFEDITIYPLLNGGRKGAVIRVDNVTEKVQMEEMMVQSEKMLSLGGLAAGMAHEINNPLAGMIQTADVLSGRLWEKINLPANRKAAEEVGLDLTILKTYMEHRKIPEMLETLTISGIRIAEIVNNMLSFAKKSKREVRPGNLNTLLDATLKLAESDYNLKKQYDFKQIAIVKEYDESLPKIMLDSPKIQQVLLNLFRNGSQAMIDGNTESPTLIIRTKLDNKRHMAVVEIEDNGPGMTEDVKARIFEPFFTTKPVGEGTGLGLSVSYFIITESHHGEMTVESRPDHGTKFIISLPMESD